MTDDEYRAAQADLIRSLCACRSDDAETCMRLRCGPSRDWDGRPEQCSCLCHHELAELYEEDEWEA